MYRTFLSSVGELQQMIDFMDRMVNTSWSEGNFTPTKDPVFNLPVDIWEEEHSCFIRAAVPGVKPEDLEITVQDSVLTISGEIAHPWAEGQNIKFWRLESSYGKFRRAIRLPEQLNTQDIEASFDHGFITVAIPKLVPESKTIRVSVKQASAQPTLGESTSKVSEKALETRRTNGVNKVPVGSKN